MYLEFFHLPYFVPYFVLNFLLTANPSHSLFLFSLWPLVCLTHSMLGSWHIVNRRHSPRLETWQVFQYRTSLSKPAQGLAVAPAHNLLCCPLYVNVRHLLSPLVLPYIGTTLVIPYYIVLSYIRKILAFPYYIVLSFVRTTLVIPYYILLSYVRTKLVIR
jgi:hypothetical protein